MTDVRTLIDIVESRATDHPDREIYTFLEQGDIRGPSETWTASDVRRHSLLVAAHLQQQGLQGERVLLLIVSGLEFVAAFLGCLHAGAIAVPVHPPDPRQLKRTIPRIRSIIENCQPKGILTTAAIAEAAEILSSHAPELKSMRWLAVDDLDPSAASLWQRPTVSADDLAFLQYTSGSTRAPRGVRVSHGNLSHNIAWISRRFGVTAEDTKGVLWLPPYHDMGLIGGILTPIHEGAPIVLMSPLDFLRQPRRWLEAISETKAVASGAPNFAYELAIKKTTPEQRAQLDLSTLRVAFTGAEPVRASTLDRFASAFEVSGFRRSAFAPCYGLAEATLLVSIRSADEGPRVRSFSASALGEGRVVEAPADDPGARALVGCGPGLEDQTIRIVEPESGQLCAARSVGEIWLAGPGVTDGYWEDAERTEYVFGAELTGEEGTPYLRTGDMGFLFEGELFVTTRLKDLIIVRGRNYHPQDLEETVDSAHAAIRSGCCSAFRVDGEFEERVAVAVELAVAASEVDFADAAATIRAAIARDHGLLIHDVVLLAPREVPKTSSGKIQRHACRKQFDERTWDELYRERWDSEVSR